MKQSLKSLKRTTLTLKKNKSFIHHIPIYTTKPKPRISLLVKSRNKKKVMDLDWCTVCNRHTNGSLYCSEECRLMDTPDELKSAPAPIRTSNLKSLKESRSRAYSVSSEDEDEIVDRTFGTKSISFATRYGERKESFTEADYIMAFAKPFGLDHRQRLEDNRKEQKKMAKYVMRRGLPSAYNI